MDQDLMNPIPDDFFDKFVALVGHPEIMDSMIASTMERRNNPPTQGRRETNWEGLPAKELFQAVTTGDVTELNRLLTRPEFKQRVNDLDGDGHSLLHIIPITEDFDTAVQALVTAGIDIDIRRAVTEETALHEAILHQEVVPVKVLLKYGARIDTRNWRGHMPIPTAQAVCWHDAGINEDCCKVLKLLLDAEAEWSQRAEALRLEGNQLFAKGDFVKAKKLYTQSLEVYEDPRTFANRAQCFINIAKQDLKYLECEEVFPTNIQLCGREAVSDALKALEMDSSYAKAHYRLVLGYLLQRNTSGAYRIAIETLEQYPENKKLQELKVSLAYLHTDPEADEADFRKIIITA